MAFFTRKQSKDTGSPKANSTTPSSPFSPKNLLTQQIVQKVAKDKIPEWEEVLAISTEELRIWLLSDKEQLTAVPKEDYGFFFNTESYIVLKTFNHKARLCYNIHFWFGSEKAKKVTTPPAKVQQLVQLLNERVVVYREVEGYESPVFRRYFPTFGVRSGGLQAAFSADKPDAYKARLLHFHENKMRTRVEVREVPVSRKSLKSGDVYIYDEGRKMTQWNGKKCDDAERLAARKYIENALKMRKCLCTSEFHDEEDLFDSAEVYKKLGNAEVPSQPMKLDKNVFKKTMYRLSDKSGKLSLTPVPVARTNIYPEDVAFVDARQVLYVQLGPTASENEKNNSWQEASKYLKSKDAPLKSICLFAAGSYCQPFEQLWTKKD